MAKKAETVFRARVLRDLQAIPGVAIRAIQQKTIRGDSDYHLCIRGCFVALELKTDTGKVDKLQEFKLNEIRKAGGIGIVARPKTWEYMSMQLYRFATQGVAISPPDTDKEKKS